MNHPYVEIRHLEVERYLDRYEDTDEPPIEIRHLIDRRILMNYL